MRFIFPPHPDKNLNIRPELVGILESKGGWVAQRKFNGSHCVVWVRDGVVAMWNRRGEPFTTYTLTPQMISCVASLDIPAGVEVVLDGELLHTKAKSKITKKQAVTDTVVFFDILYYGKYLLTNTFQERYDMLRKVCGNPNRSEEKKRALSVVSYGGSNVWLAENFRNDFLYRFYEFFDFDGRENDKFPEIEGLVCKKSGPSSKLKLGDRPYDVDWMVRVRKTKENIYLF